VENVLKIVTNPSISLMKKHFQIKIFFNSKQKPTGWEDFSTDS